MKPQYEKLIADHRAKVERLKEVHAHYAPKNETPLEKKLRIAKLIGDYAKFCRFYFPHYCTSPSASFHIALADKLKKNKKCLLVRKWPRGHAKSVNAGIFIPIWLMLQGEIKFMVLASANNENAIKLLGDLQAELEANQILIDDFGDFVSHGAWELGDFTTKQGTRFKAIGRGQSPRGLRNRQYRPDFILGDDMDDDKLVKNEKLVRQAYEWLFGALYGALSTQGGRVVIVANLISHTSILAYACKHPLAEVEQIDALLADGTPAWHEKNSVADIEEQILGFGSSRMAQRELFHNPITEGKVFKQDWFKFKETLNLQNYDLLVCYTDPSFKSSSKNDYKATVVIGKKGAEYHILKCYLQQTTVTRMVAWHYDIKQWAGDVPVQFYMEANFVQDLLLDDFRQEADKRGYPVGIRPDKRSKPDKFGRIENLSPLFERGHIFINKDEENNKDMLALIDQFMMFESGSRAPDDGPDAVEGAIFLLNHQTKAKQKPVFISRRTNKNTSY